VLLCTTFYTQQKHTRVNSYLAYKPASYLGLGPPLCFNRGVARIIAGVHSILA